MKRIIIFILAASALAAVTTTINADERTGRELGMLVKELDQELAEARSKVEVLEKQRVENMKGVPADILPKRGEALRELENLTNDFDDEKNPQDKRVLADQIEKKVLEIAGHSADFLENQKNSLVNQDQQLEVIEETMSTIIRKMNRLEALTANGKNGTDGEEMRAKARKSLRNVAKMVEMLAARDGKSQRWRSVRQTIALQNKLLKRTLASGDKIQQMLKSQKQVYEQVLAQISIARQQIAIERDVLGQVALGEVARSLLRRAAGLLLGNHSIQDIGRMAVLKSEERQQDLLAFMEQDEINGDVYSGLDDESYDDYPDGYQDFLAEN